MDLSAVTERSTMMTGILASLASCRTASQPVSTTGGRAMTFTPCWMQDAHGGDLVFLLLLGIREDQLDAQFFSSFFE